MQLTFDAKEALLVKVKTVSNKYANEVIFHSAISRVG